jgi:hypothetical protein
MSAPGMCTAIGKHLTLAQIAKAARGHLNNGWINVQGPGHGAADRSLGFRFDATAPNGFRVHSLAGDSPGISRAHVKALLDRILVGSLDLRNERPVSDVSTVRRHTDVALKIWAESQSVIGSPVQPYLETRRCWNPETLASSEALRFHPAPPRHLPLG